MLHGSNQLIKLHFVLGRRAPFQSAGFVKTTEEQLKSKD